MAIVLATLVSSCPEIGGTPSSHPLFMGFIGLPQVGFLKWPLIYGNIETSMVRFHGGFVISSWGYQALKPAWASPLAWR